MAVKIERGIPVPSLRGKYTKYPFGQMKKGDSFLVEPGTDINGLRQAASHYARRSGEKMKFSTLKTREGYRCWRVE